MPKDKLILVGVISAAHGIKGDFIVKSFTHPPENIVNLIVQDDLGSVFKLKYIHSKKDAEIVCHLSGYETRSQAETLKRTALYCKRSELPKKAEDEFYFEDLKGLIVQNEEGFKIGTVINVMNYGAGDIIEIMFTNIKGTEFFPFDQNYFPIITENFITLKK